MWVPGLLHSYWRSYVAKDCYKRPLQYLQISVCICYVLLQEICCPCAALPPSIGCTDMLCTPSRFPGHLLNYKTNIATATATETIATNSTTKIKTKNNNNIIEKWQKHRVTSQITCAWCFLALFKTSRRIIRNSTFNIKSKAWRCVEYTGFFFFFFFFTKFRRSF